MNRRRRDRKPWMWFEVGVWFCRSNVGTFMKEQMITGIDECPRRAYAMWNMLRKISEELRRK